MNIKRIRDQVGRGNYRIKLHALERASLRGIDPIEIREALLNGMIIEKYPDDSRGQSCLICGKTQKGKDIHVVCGIAYDTIWIITVYEPDPEEWTDSFTRRKIQ